MAIYRTQGDIDFKNYGDTAIETTSHLEWADEVDKGRIDEESWLMRYKYEAAIIESLCKSRNYRKVLELGSGPGQMGQFVLETLPQLEYSYIDKATSKAIYQKRGFKGKEFYVKDLMHYFDISGLETDYDLIIANDFLEHIANPSHVLTQARAITKPESGFFISVPNWRMNHEFIYRGLFDCDNFLYFCSIHGWSVIELFDSPLKCANHSRLCSEEALPEELVDSWNWYTFSIKQD